MVREHDNSRYIKKIRGRIFPLNIEDLCGEEQLKTSEFNSFRKK
jgi:hypothetical protein